MFHPPPPTSPPPPFSPKKPPPPLPSPPPPPPHNHTKDFAAFLAARQQAQQANDYLALVAAEALQPGTVIHVSTPGRRRDAKAKVIYTMTSHQLVAVDFYTEDDGERTIHFNDITVIL